MNARTTRYNLAREDAIERGWKVPPEGSPLDAPDWHEAWINYWHACERYEADPSGGRPIQPHRSGGGMPAPRAPAPEYTTTEIVNPQSSKDSRK